MKEHVLLLLLVVAVVHGAPFCAPEVEVCEFTLVAEARLTMMHGQALTYPSDGELYDYTVTNISDSQPILDHNVISADGWKNSRLVYVFNGTLPGPAIEVWENQWLKVHVVNNLHNDAITVHWHGMHQSGTPFMDGVGFVSQCPILAGQTFTYKFKAQPKGTFWYHPHVGSQRTMGLYGPLVVHEREPVKPVFPEFIWTVSDWNHEYDSETGFFKMGLGLNEGSNTYQPTKSMDGGRFGHFQFHSGLLNGKGRYYNTETGEHNGAPLSTFSVIQGESYRIRVIAAGELYPFRISVDQHLLTVIASDGYYLEPVTAQSFIINPGERFDFVLNTTQPVGNYWIRGETLEVGVNHTLEAILRYEGAFTDEDPDSEPRNCTWNETCVVVNCPFSFYPEDETLECLTFGDLRSEVIQDTPQSDQPGFEEHFLNFAFPVDQSTPGSINGITLKLPSVAAVAQSHGIDSDCDRQNCSEGKMCRCTWSLPIGHGTTHQFIFMNLGSKKGWSLPVHMHGHSFYVVKIGYAQYNETTGEIVGDNPDIHCGGNPDLGTNFCNNASWSDPTWGNGNITGLVLEKPLRKDTVVVPTGGYAVVRIRADNPGVWIIHSQVQLHGMDGMAMLLNESHSQLPVIPDNFPTCQSNFEMGEVTVVSEPGLTTPAEGPSSTSEPQPESGSGYDPDSEPEPEAEGTVFSREMFWAVVGCLLGVIGILFFILVLYMCLHRTSGGRSQAYSFEPDATKYAFQNKASQF